MAARSLCIPAAALTHVARSLLAATPAVGSVRADCADWAREAALAARIVRDDANGWERELLAKQLTLAAEASWLAHDATAQAHAKWAADQAPWPDAAPESAQMLEIVAGDLETLARTLAPVPVEG